MNAFAERTDMRPDEAALDEMLHDLVVVQGGRVPIAPGLSLAEHSLLAAAAAERAGATDGEIVAALLHDVGHLFTDTAGVHAPRHGHDLLGAEFLTGWFGPEVVEPVRQHVAARRYLCSVDRSYAGRIGARARGDGAVMTFQELRQFASGRHAEAAVRVRRWDDAARRGGAPVPRFDRYRPLLLSLARSRPSRALAG